MLSGDIVLPHEVCNLQVSLDLSGGFSGLSPGETVSLRWGSSSSSFPREFLVLGQVASLFVADEALAVSNVLCYNSFPLSFYSIDCSLLSSTYLER